MRKLLIPFFLFVFAAPAFAQRVDLGTAAKLVRVSDPQITPDGTSVAIVVSRPNYAENRQDADIVVVDAATRAQRVLVTTMRSVGTPRWSPDGQRLAFLAQVDGRPQIHVVAARGGSAAVLTRSPTGVINFAWRPDGRSIAFTAFDEPVAGAGEERFNRSFEAGRHSYLQIEAPRPVHLWLKPLSDEPAKRLTSGSWTLPAPFPPGPAPAPPSWSADGRSLAFVKTATVFSGERGLSTVQIIDVDRGTTRALTTRQRGEQQPVFSPDGSSIAYWIGDPMGGGTDIFVAPASGGFGANTTGGLDRNVLRALWMPDGKSMLLAANDRTTTGLWLQPLQGEAQRLDLGSLVASASFGLDASISRAGRIALVASEPLRPAELFVLEHANAKPQRLTDFNAAVAGMQLGRTETIEWDGPDGFRQDGVVTYPPDFESGRKYPLVLYIHGGPRSTSKEAFSPRAQLLAAQGWIVFEPNYRGSDNRGAKFMIAIQNDAGAGPGRDVMSGVAHLQSRGFIDEKRMAVSGWSYGGYMTTWLIGNFPDAWRAAVAGAPVTDNMDQYNLSDGNSSRGSAFGGSPYTAAARMQAFAEQSPIHYVGKVKTPTLLMALSGDYRVPITQAYSYYHALRDNNVPVKFVVYPLPGHSPTDPVHQRDVDRRWVEWIKTHLEAAPTTTTTTPSAQAPAPLAAAAAAKIDAVFADYSKPGSPGCAVAVYEGDRIAFQKAYGMANLDHKVPLSPSSVFHVASVSKQFTAAAILLLAADGKLSLDDDIRKHLPELPDFGRTITIRHLGNHTSGMRDQWDLLTLAGWRYSRDLITDDDVYDLLVRQKDLNFAPGERHLYSNSGYTLMAMIVSRVSGKSFRAFTSERIFTPLGMNNTHFRDTFNEIVPNQAYGYSPWGDTFRLSVTNFDTAGATSLLTTVEDLLKWHMNFETKTVGGESLQSALLERGLLNNGTKIDYAFGISHGTYRGERTIGHGGSDAGYRADFVRFPDHRLGIATLCNIASANPGALSRRVADVFLPPPTRVTSARLTDVQAAAAASAEEPEMPMDEQALRKYVGLYWSASEFTARNIVLENGKLNVAMGGERVPLKPVASGVFVMTSPARTRLAFEELPGGGMQVRPAGAPTALVRSEAYAPDAKALAAFEGVYRSDEMDMVIRMRVKEGAIEVRRQKSPAAYLRPIVKDAFQGPMGVYQFTRDAAGRITGFALQGNRIRNVKFWKERTPAGS